MMQYFLTNPRVSDSVKPLSEKLRPTNFDDLILDEKIKSRFKKMYDENNIMNMLFYGKAGTGKTTAAMIFASNEAYDETYFNISLDNSIDNVRENIIGSATSRSFFGSKRLLILDEVEALSATNQNALKVTIERYSNYCRFILITNNPDKIIEPIKSRLKSINFDQIPDDSEKLISEYRKKVVNKIESMHGKFNQEEIDNIENMIEDKYPDYRAIANEIEFAGY